MKQALFALLMLAYLAVVLSQIIGQSGLSAPNLP